LVVVGVLIVGIVSASGSSGDTSVLGILLLLLAQCFTGGQFIAEELILADSNPDPLLLVGLEGFWGCCYFAILLPIF
jgi:drug/metabolite transporter (DMT)-like permease